MSGFDKWVDRIYGETDFGRSVATSLAGMAGLVVYLAARDWVIAAFSAVIAFPIVRLLATWMYEKVRRASARQAARERAAVALQCLSGAERQVVSAFVQAGGAVLTWSQTNQLAVSGPAIESLIHRDLICTSMTADGMRETFVLDEALFDAALRDAAKVRVASKD